MNISLLPSNQFSHCTCHHSSLNVVSQAIRDEINEHIGESQGTDQADGTIVTRKLNALAYEQAADPYGGRRQLHTIIETQDM